MGPQVQVATRPFGVEVNVNAIAAIVQAMITGGRTVLEDGDWLRMQAAEAFLAPHEHAALEVLRARLQSGASLLKEASATTWYS